MKKQAWHKKFERKYAGEGKFCKCGAWVHLDAKKCWCCGKVV